MAKGRRNNKRGRGGSQNTTNDSDANLSGIGYDGSGDVRNHKGFSTGAFGTSDIDGSGLQEDEVVSERNEMNRPEDFRREVHIPSRSRTSSMGVDSNEGFLHPKDYANEFGQHSQSSVRSRTSISNFEHRQNRMSQLSIQTNQDEFVLVPGSGGLDGHASIRSMRSQVSRQSANVAMSSRDDILTEGDETLGDELREEETRVRLGSRASQLSRGSAFHGEVEIPIREVEIPIRDESTAGFRSRRQSENANGEWETALSAQNKRSHTSLYSHKSNGWNERETQNGVNGPSRHASRASVHSRGGNGWEAAGEFGGEEVGLPVEIPHHASVASLQSCGGTKWDQGATQNGFIHIPSQDEFVHVPSRHESRASLHSRGGDTVPFGGEDIDVPAHLTRHESRLSVMSHRSNMDENEGFKEICVGKRTPAPSHHSSRMSVTSHRSNLNGENGYDDGSKLAQVQKLGSNAPSNYSSKLSVYSSASHGGAPVEMEEWGEETTVDAHSGERVHIPFRGASLAPSRCASKTSVHSFHDGAAPSYHGSKVSILSHAGGDAGILAFSASRPHSMHASRASLYSHPAGDHVVSSRAPSIHASRASLHSHAHMDEVENGGMNQFFIPGGEEGIGRRTSRTSTRSQMSCIACADDEGGVEENDKYRLPQLGDEIEVPPTAVDHWGEYEDKKMEEQGETMQDNGGYGETGYQWGEHGVAREENGGMGQRSRFGSRVSVGSHAAPSIGGRSHHHASRMSMRSTMDDIEEKEDGGRGLQQSGVAFGGSAAPIPAIRLSRASLNQPNIDCNHNSMGSLHAEFTDQNEFHIPSHHASKMSLRSVRSEMPQTLMQTAHSKTSVHSRQSAPRERRFSSRSTQDVAEWGETVKDEDEEVFEGNVGYKDEYDGGMSRGASHQSIYSTRSSKAGEQTEENLLQARLNRSREPSLASLGDRPYIPPKDGWKSSAHSVKSTRDNERKHRSHRSRSSINLVGTGIDLRNEVVLPLNLPVAKPRSRSASIASRRSYEGVAFADQPELYSHPDDRFGGDKSIDGIPFRRTNEHEKTPQPSSKKTSRMYKQYESEEELRALVSSASASHTSVIENTPPPSAGFQTPRSRNSRESYLGTAEISMPSPTPFNQTQFQRDEYEAYKEREAARAATFLPMSPSSQQRSEMATQTGETIARAAGHRFAIHYGATLSEKPHEAMGMGETPCLLQHQQPMGEEERRRREQAALYSHGDTGEMRDEKFSRTSYDMRYVGRSTESSSKTTTTSSSTLKSQYASGASSYVDHLRPVQPSPAHTSVNVNGGRGQTMEMATTSGGYVRNDIEQSLFSPSKGTVAQKAAAFRQKEESERGTITHQEFTPGKSYLQQQGRAVNRQVPIEIVRGGEEIVIPIERKEEPKVVNVQIQRATSSVGLRPLQQKGYVHIDRPKMNNSFEKNNHPAAAVLNSMLTARASSPTSEKDREDNFLARKPSTGGMSGGGYVPQRPMSNVFPPQTPTGLKPIGSQGIPTTPTSAGYQRSIRPLASDGATYHYEIKYDLYNQQEQRMNEEISKDEQAVLSKVGPIRADVSPKGITQIGRQSMRSREAERAYTNYHDKKSVGAPFNPVNTAPKPFTPLSPYRSVPQQQVYGGYRARTVPQAPTKQQPTRAETTPSEKEQGGERRVAAPFEMEKGETAPVTASVETSKYTGSTIRRAIPQRGHIRSLAAAFDTIQTTADREVTVIEPHNSSGQRHGSTVAPSSGGGRGVGGGSTCSGTSSGRGFALRNEGMQKRGGAGGDVQGVQLRVPVQLQQNTGTTTSGSTRREEGEQFEMMRRSGYNERSIHEWQTANERQMRQVQQREEAWSGREQEDEDLLLDSESDRPLSIHSGGAPKGLLPVHALRTSTPLAGVKNDPRTLVRALEKIPSIRGDDTLRRGRDTIRGGAVARIGGVRALASRFEKAAEEETEKARSASMTPRIRRREEGRRVEGDDEDRREAAARRLSRGVGGIERLEREKEKRRSQSAHGAVRKRRSSSTSDSGEESVMREMEAVERMAREELLRKEREEMRGRKAMKGGVKNEVRRQSEEERKIDEMFHGLESQESAGERGTVASSRGTMSGAESVRTERLERREMHQQQVLQHQEYQYQQKYREHHQHQSHQSHHYQAHAQSVNHQSNGVHVQSVSHQQRAPSQQEQQRPVSPSNYMAAHLHPIGANGGLEHGYVSRRESTQTMHTTTQSSTGTAGLVYSPSVYRETGRALRGDASSSPNNGMLELPVEHGRRQMEMNVTASSPHFSPVNIRGPVTAGQRVATYESRDGRNPIRVPSRQVRPYALATSTPMGTVQSSARGNTLVNEEGAVIPAEAVEDDSFLSTISGESSGMGARNPANQAEYKKQIARLQTVQSMEEEKISITSKALAHARKKQNPSNELAAQRTILLARLRVAALKRELQRLSALAIVRNPPPPVSKNVLGAMDISDITLHLNRNLCAKPTDGGGACSFGFIVVLKCGVEVEATAPVTLLVPARPAGIKVVHFPEHLRFSNLPVDFAIRLEVYVMKLREPKEESCTALLATKARNLLTPGTRRAAITAGPGGSSGSGGSPCAVNGELPVGELVRCGHTALDRDSVGSMRLYLDAPEYPLEGTIELASSYRCSRLPSSVEVDLRGFLTMYKVVGGYGSWVRYWAVLRRGVINFWKYPDDEQLDRGGPVASADLSKCTDGEIIPASREICTRQFAFSIDMLVATTPSIVEKKRVLLAADNRDQLKAWLASLNETLAAIRA